MDIVDGIWSSQVGVKLSLAPSTVLKTSQEPFSTTQGADGSAAGTGGGGSLDLAILAVPGGAAGFAAGRRIVR